MFRQLAIAAPLLLAAPAMAQTGPASPSALGGGGDWSGFYAGVQIDAVSGSARFDFSGYDLSGVVPGVFVGYRHDFGGVVLGGELDYQRGRVTAGRDVDIADRGDPPMIVRENREPDLERLVRFGLEAGVEAGPALVYATAGWAHIAFEGEPTADSGGSGHFYGLGVDYALGPRVSVGAEILRHHFGDLGFAGYSADPVTLGLNLAVRF